MKSLLTLGVVTLAVFTMACGGGSSDQTDDAKNAPPAQEMSEDHADHGDHDGHDHPVAGEKAEMLQTGTEISLDGTMGCGHCNFKIGSSCSAAMKTADGHIVIFDDVPQDSEMFKNRMDGAAVTVAGVVSYDDSGVAHLKLKDTPM